MKRTIVFRAEVFQEGDQYVGLCPEIDVSSFGDTVEEAKALLKEAVELFLEECEAMGQLDEILEEAGFSRIGAQKEKWVTRQPVCAEIMELVGA